MVVNRIMPLIILGFLFLMVYEIPLHGQPVLEASEEVPYYIDVNTARATSQAHQIHHAMLSLQYFDGYGKSDEVLLEMFDWKRTLVAKVSLTKTYGLNHFTINLDQLFEGWEKNKTYTCALVDEGGKLYEVPFTLVEVNKTDPQVDILVNPVTLKCDDVSGNLVEFYGQISGGKAPYVVSWFIMNSMRNDFIYQPREEKIDRAGKTMLIEVDKAPDYYVLLKVKDSCGGAQQKMVHLMCKDDLKKVNTLFVEPIALPVANKIR